MIYKEKEVVRLRDYTPEEIDNLPRVSAFKAATEQQKQIIIDLNNSVKRLKQQQKIKPKEIIKTIGKTVAVERALTEDEIENLPRVQYLVSENAQLRRENEELSAQVDEYQEGISYVVNRILDEGYEEMANSITKTNSIFGMYEKIADFISSLKIGISTIKNSINSFKNKIPRN